MLPPKGILKFLKVDNLIHTLTDYAETRIALMKVEVKDEIAKALRAALIYIAMALMAFFFALFLSLTIALVLNHLLDSTFWGFVIVTGLYLVVLLTLYSLRNSPKVKALFIDGSTKIMKAKDKPSGHKVARHDQAEEAVEPDFERAHVEFPTRPDKQPTGGAQIYVEPTNKETP